MLLKRIMCLNCNATANPSVLLLSGVVAKRSSALLWRYGKPLLIYKTIVINIVLYSRILLPYRHRMNEDLVALIHKLSYYSYLP